ncbi:UNVERIFIED_CONTAM: E3 ubiquitin-protein ligase listerin [Sesamum calycinum]|uniref:E3 ubiquitin-protein ligase listerin n=1 Tax=Sesamum calycinum TaxID=2727403 RepID=A0AAW2S9A1_9LAMI
MGRAKGEAARAKSRPSSSRFFPFPPCFSPSSVLNHFSECFENFCESYEWKTDKNCSMAASLLPSGVTAVGFGGYVGSSRVDSSLASAPDASPFLAFEYKKLLLDYNREVRRATHDTMTNLVVAVGRDLAPHLKPLIGPWWFSQFDSIYEVSQAAKRSFQTAFPAQERRVDALMLYSAEIFTYIEENLKLTPQSLSDKETPSDELEEMHQQAVNSDILCGDYAVGKKTNSWGTEFMMRML